MQAKPIRNERPDQTFDDEFGETEYLKTEKSPKIEVQGNKDNMNLIGPVLIAILSSDYFKSLSELKSFSPVITEIERSVTDLEPFGSLNIASKCFCLMFKLFKNKLTERQMEAMLSNYESVYVRAMGLLYLRLCGPFKDLYDWFEPHFSDDEEFNMARTATKMTTLGEYAKKLLTEQKHFSILLPRIPVMIQRAINDNIKQWNIDNNVKSADDDKYKVKERNRGHSPDPRLEEIREEKARRERSEDRAYEKDTRDERRRDERDRRDDRDRREEDRGRDRYRDDRDRRRDDRRDDRDRDRKDDRERRDDRRDERDRRDDRDRYRRDEREDRYRDDRDRRERREDRDRDDESRRRADRDRRDERRDDRDRDRKDNKRSPSPRGSPQPGETKKPKVDMQKLMDIYGPSDSSQKYNANPTLGATEVVRIGFGKY